VLPTHVDVDHVSGSRRGFGGKSGYNSFAEEGLQFPDQTTWYGGSFGMWSTKNGFGPEKRPLNRFIYRTLGEDLAYAEIEAMDLARARQDEKLEFEAFRCPSDVGYEPGRDGDVDVLFGYGLDIHREYKDQVPLYSAMGNSYATDAVLTTGGANNTVLAWGVFFRPHGQVPNPSRVTAYIEGKGFYAMFWNDRVFQEETSYTWGNHGTLREHNVGFADGHAAPVLFEVRDNVTGFNGNTPIMGAAYTMRGGTTSGFDFNPPVDQPTSTLGDWDHLLTNGPDWQSHCQPAPPVQSDSVSW
jgi:prepilin-type processing-associated H-X9-DG protein